MTVEDLYMAAVKIGAEKHQICIWEDNGVDSYWTGK